MIRKYLIKIFLLILIGGLTFLFIFWFNKEYQNRDTNIVNVKNFSDIQAAVDWLKNRGGGIIYFPAGIYRIQKPIIVYNDITLKGEDGAIIENLNIENAAAITLQGNKIKETKIIKVEEKEINKQKIYIENPEDFEKTSGEYIIITNPETQHLEFNYIISQEGKMLTTRYRLKNPLSSYEGNKIELVKLIQNVTIENLTIKGNPKAGLAIYLSYSENINIRENNITHNLCGIIAQYTFNSLIEQNLIKENGFGLPKPCGGGTYLTQSNNNTITKNRYLSSGYTVIALEFSDSNFISENVSLGAGANLSGDGIAFSNSNSNIVKNNVLRRGSCYGMWIKKSSYNIFAENIVEGGVTTGINIDQESSFNLISKNIVKENLSHGILLNDKAKNNLVVDNLVSRNGLYGIFLYDLSCDNQVKNNILENNGLQEIFVEPTCKNHLQANQILE